MKKTLLFLIFVISFSFTAGSLRAEVKVHNIFGHNMVLQRGRPVKVWGWADAGESVTVTYSDQTKKAIADDKGCWSVMLDTLKAGTEPAELIVKGTSNSITFENVVVGDVWLCGGQSNMEDVLEDIYHGDTEVISANHPNIRLITIPQVASPRALLLDPMHSADSEPVLGYWLYLWAAPTSGLGHPDWSHRCLVGRNDH
jgi:sialate O-acetylesterase